MTHYYTLNMMKTPNSGGWQYHQDYGYHYQQFLYTDYISVMVALDPATRDNGCLRVVKGSNQLGRLEHSSSGSQLIADPDRLEVVLRHMDEVHCEMSPGSVLYFHGNTLHASDPNLSEQSRYSLIYSYVAASNVWVLPDEQNGCTRVDGLSDADVADSLNRHWDRVQSAN